MHAATEKLADIQRILVIEDDPLVRFNIVSYLEDSGFEVSEVDSGNAGLSAIQSDPPDLVVCDLRMPGLDGLDVLETLHADHPELPIVVVSGTGVISDAINALRKGAWDFITKPVQDMAVLEHAIVAALDKARLIRDNRRIHMELEHANRLLRQNLEQFEQDAAAGRSLQLQMMPAGNRVLSGYRFNRYLLPSLYLSGDFVDYFVIDHSHVGFYLADVAGHGASSAFVTILLNSFVHRYLDLLQNEGEKAVLAPDQMLGHLNRHLLDQKLEKYLTMFYGVIDVDSNRMSYSSGGHFPSPVLFDGSESRFLDGRGPPVGLFVDAQFDRHSIALPENHVLAVCSDGIMDALPEQGLDIKRERLKQAVSQFDLSVESTLASLGLSPEGAYPDDITLLLVERRA